MKTSPVKGKKRVVFTVDADPGAAVCVVGSFNNWEVGGKRLTAKPGSRTFSTTVMLPPGEHQYKFVIDGVWCVDPNCPNWIANDYGTLNSVRNV